ncbi:hypothetical protein SAMN05421803_12112 [Nocardiopsis flavescens]|uniref:VTC domain-containing protein n=1 Tax=Nocardiopsis flavescens TaxID=758803 RepID=A0A1M6SSX9_9ACTN|nr:hypothetical protein SAMN05421803_12112 [Nocardiopsis flavescens]
MPTDTSPAADRLRAPSRLHAFDRYELEYLVPRSRPADVRAEPGARMGRDPCAGDGGHAVRSLYYDTDRLLHHRPTPGPGSGSRPVGTAAGRTRWGRGRHASRPTPRASSSGSRPP